MPWPVYSRSPGCLKRHRRLRQQRPADETPVSRSDQADEQLQREREHQRVTESRQDLSHWFVPTVEASSTGTDPSGPSPSWLSYTPRIAGPVSAYSSKRRAR